MTKTWTHNSNSVGRRSLSLLLTRAGRLGNCKATGSRAVSTFLSIISIFLLVSCFATPAFADALDPKLLESLSRVDSSAPYTVEENKTAVYNIESQGPVAVESLLSILKDPASKYRAQAAFVLGKLAPSDEVVRALTAALSATEPHVVAAAATALGEIGPPTAVSAVPELLNTAQRESKKVRVTAIVVTSKGSAPQQTEVIQGNAEVKAAVAKALGKLGNAAKAGYKTLLLLLDDPDASVRDSAARSLTKVGGDSSELLTALTLLLHDSNLHVRNAALEGLGELNGDSAVIIPKLIDLFEREDRLLSNDSELFFGVGTAIAKYGADAVAPLMVALSDKNKQAGAAYTLGLLGTPALPAVPKLIQLAKSGVFPVDHWAMESLAKLGPLTDEKPLDVLVYILGSKDESAQKSAIVAIIIYTDVMQTVESDVNDVHRLYKTIDALKRVKAVVKANHEIAQQTGVTEVKLDSYISIVRRIKDQQSGVIGKQLVEFAKEHKFALAPVAWVTFWTLFWSVIFFVKPASIVEINNRMSRVTDFSLMAMPLHHFFLVSLFRYHPHVLDAWVRSKLPRIQKCFEAKDTVAERDMYLPAPVVLNGKALATLSAPDLRACQHLSNRILFLIWGEGGLGKTTLACQIARWGMSEDPQTSLLGRPVIPIFIEHDLLIDSKQDMVLQTVRGQIALLIGEIPPPEDLVRQLLRQKRAMVIIDHFSEMLQSTRRFIRPGSATFFVNLMVITSRIDEPLDSAPKNTIRPMRIQGDRLSSFMEAYLTARGKRELFDDSEYFDHCRRLSVLVGKGNTTVLLAKLYADQMIASKEGPDPIALNKQLPDNIPDLMLCYLNELNKSARKNDPDNHAVQEYCKTIAWECVRPNFKPGAVKRTEAVEALKAGHELTDLEQASSRVKYLEERAHLLHPAGPAQDQLRFSLDPLVEYLAALKVMALNGSDTKEWRKIIDRAQELKKEGEVIDGFLLALIDCVKTKRSEWKVPHQILEELERLPAKPEPAVVKVEPSQVAKQEAAEEEPAVAAKEAPAVAAEEEPAVAANEEPALAQKEEKSQPEVSEADT